MVELYTRGYPLPTAGRTLYEIPEIRTAINFIAEKVASVPLRHVRMVGEGEMLPLDDQVQRLLAVRPNPYNSPQSFVNVVVSRLLVNGNAYIYPEWEGGKLKALWPLPFSSHSYEKDEAGILRIAFQSGGNRYGFLLEDIIHLSRYPALQGASSLTSPVSNYVNILSTMQAQAVEDAETADRVRALLEAQTPLKLADMKKSLDEFKSLYMTAENTTGMGAIPYGYKVIPLDMKKLPLNVELLNSVTRQLYNYYGISFEIINGNATELQYEQFVDNTVKPICYQMEEEFTYKLFTEREISAGHRIQAQAIDLMIAPLSAQTTFLKEMLFAGVITRNEARLLHGLPRGPEELDGFLTSKNFEATDDAMPEEAPEEIGPIELEELPEGMDIQQTALNGAQVESLLTIINNVAIGAIPRETGIQLLMAAFQFTKEQAEAIMGEVGRNFKPAIQEGGGDAGTGKNDGAIEGQAGPIPEAGA